MKAEVQNTNLQLQSYQQHIQEQQKQQIKEQFEQLTTENNQFQQALGQAISHLPQGQNVDSIFKKSDAKKTDSKGSSSVKSEEKEESQGIFGAIFKAINAIVGDDETADEDVIDSYNEMCGGDIDAKTFGDVWETVGEFSKNLADQKNNIFKEMSQTIQAMKGDINAEFYEANGVVVPELQNENFDYYQILAGKALAEEAHELKLVA